MKIPLTSSHLISMSQIIYMKDPTRTDSKNSSYFLPLNTYPEYNRPIQENILYNTFTYTRFSHWKFSLILYFIQYLRLVLHISPSKRISRTVFSHVAFPCLTSPPFAAPFEPSPSFYFVSLYRPPPPSFEAMGASSGVQAIIPSGWNSIGTTEMAQGSWPMA